MGIKVQAVDKGTFWMTESLVGDQRGALSPQDINLTWFADPDACYFLTRNAMLRDELDFPCNHFFYCLHVVP